MISYFLKCKDIKKVFVNILTIINKWFRFYMNEAVKPNEFIEITEGNIMVERVLVLNDVSKSGLNFLSDHEVGQKVENPTAIIVRSAKVETKQYPNLDVVARAGTGVDNISTKEATEAGICVFNSPGANANAVAELVFLMLGLFARRINQALQFVRDLDWKDENTISKVEKGKSQFRGFELSGKTLGVIGLGKIGIIVSNIGISLGMRVIGYDPFPVANGRLSPKVEVVQKMEDIFAVADIISVHVPLSEKTRHLISAKQIALMRPNCVLMNYSRDGIYDDAAVIEALNARQVAAFITDFPTRELCQNQYVICTPHLGASSVESEENCSLMAAQQLNDYLSYGVVKNSVNFPELTTSPLPTVRTRLAVVSKNIPDMIAIITGVLGESGINIQALANRSRDNISYSLVDLEVDIDDEVIERIRQLPNVLKVRVLKFP